MTMIEAEPQPRIDTLIRLPDGGEARRTEYVGTAWFDGKPIVSGLMAAALAQRATADSGAELLHVVLRARQPGLRPGRPRRSDAVVSVVLQASGDTGAIVDAAATFTDDRAVGHKPPRRLWSDFAVSERGSTCMSGHSKWATTKHKKAIIDARRGKNFARLIKNIEVAARVGGGDPAGNPTLYDAIQKAKKNSVPNDNIERARKRGAGEEAGGADWQTITYEGYGPNGVAVLVECLTDNRNRAAGEVRVAMTRNGGNMADPGSVSYLFSRKGVVTLEKNGLTEDDVLTAVLDAGAEDVDDLGDSFEVTCEPGDLVAVRTALQDAGIDYESAEASFQPSVTVPVDLDGARKVIKLIDALEDSDDVQDVYTNIDIPDDVAAILDEE